MDAVIPLPAVVLGWLILLVVVIVVVLVNRRGRLVRETRAEMVTQGASASTAGVAQPAAVGRAAELRAMDDRSLELIVAQHLGWKWASHQPGMPPMLVPPDAPPGSIGHVAPSYVGDPGAAWSLLVKAAESEPGIKVVIAIARGGVCDGSVEIGKTLVIGPLPRAIDEAFVLEIEKTRAAPPATPRWTPQMNVEALGTQGVGGRRVIEVPDEAAQTEQDGEQGSGVAH